MATQADEVAGLRQHLNSLCQTQALLTRVSVSPPDIKHYAEAMEWLRSEIDLVDGLITRLEAEAA